MVAGNPIALMKAHSTLSLKFFGVIGLLVLSGCASETTAAPMSEASVFKNGEGATIVFSSKGVSVSGRFYKISDCSNPEFNCKSYSGFGNLINIKYCSVPVAESDRLLKFNAIWGAGAYKATFAVLQHPSIAVLISSYNQMPYYADIFSGGIVAIIYGPGDTMPLSAKQVHDALVSGIFPWKEKSEVYSRVSGPPLLPCKNVR